ncbi:MAG: class I SAM-dependent methyltransferase [Candidatus Peribacteria bacterium]|jgi:predicted nicotinamide N-methyase|nr:class I SAM-dependent methyltransferase [Candidatus Peribacteria bacterium]
MFSLERNLASLLEQGEIKTVLDLGAGTGTYSIFCASYGCKVIAVDTQTMKQWKYPDYLLTHPNIIFYNSDINHLSQSYLDQSYDLILLFNVVPFIDKQHFLQLLLPHYLDKLTGKGKLCLTFFFADDETMSQHQPLAFYSLSDFVLPKGYKTMVQQNEKVEDIHPPYGKHKHHIGYIEISKT